MKYTHDNERWLRSQADLYQARYNPGMASAFRQCADEIHRLRMADDLHQQGAEHMREELAALEARHNALREAARVLIHDVEDKVYCESVDESKDALAALVEEE